MVNRIAEPSTKGFNIPLLDKVAKHYENRPPCPWLKTQKLTQYQTILAIATPIFSRAQIFQFLRWGIRGERKLSTQPFSWRKRTLAHLMGLKRTSLHLIHLPDKRAKYIQGVSESPAHLRQALMQYP